MKVEKEIKQVEVFKTEDGKEFLNEKDANDYVINILTRKKNVKYFQVSYSPDLTEGRGNYGRMFIAIEMDWSHSLMAELFCEQQFGSRVAWVQGCSPTNNWSVYEATKEDFESWKDRSAKVGDYYHKAKRIFLSTKSEALEGYPKPMPMPRRDNEKFMPMKEFVQE